MSAFLLQAERLAAGDFGDPCPTLRELARRFGLGEPERDAVGWAAARELAGQRPTLGDVLHETPGAAVEHWTPESALRRFRLVELDEGPFLARAARVPERVLHWLFGLDVGEPAIPGREVQVESQSRIPWEGAWTWTAPDRDAGARFLAARGLRPFSLRVEGEWAEWPALWTREAVLRGAGLVVEGSPERLAAFLDQAEFPVVAVGLEAGPDRPRVPAPGPAEREEIWRRHAGERLNGGVPRLARTFRLSEGEIARAAKDADPWAAARGLARRDLDGLAERIEPARGWDDLVLPGGTEEPLRELEAQARWRSRVYEEWGLGRGGRGLGLAALFHGPSGTGKTLAAEVLAHGLGVDLYRVDLSRVVSKYIGETEKNLSRVFAAAEGAGAVLLFDEADALFGKRSEPKDAHDRYANVEVSYLLGQMEAYDGVAVLTSNLKGAMDPAFARRFRFVVPFPFPGPEERARMWSRVFPEATPTGELDPKRLSRLALSGGSIRNVALGAAFLAASEGGTVTEERVFRAARRELAKLERPLNELAEAMR